MIEEGRVLLDGSALSEDFGRALCCQERALFFATRSKKTGLPTPPLVTWHKESKPIADTIRYRYITSIYDDAWTHLYTRLEDVTVHYLDLQRELKKKKLKAADRDENSIIESRKVIAERFDGLLKNILSKESSRRDLPSEDQLKWYRLDWKGLDNICRLVMEEITYLSSRIDEFNGLLNAHESGILTRRSLSFAVWGIGIGAAITLLSIFVSIFLANPNKSADIRKNVALYLEMGKLSEKAAYASQIAETSNSEASASHQK